MGVVESIGGDGGLDERRRAAPECESESVGNGTLVRRNITCFYRRD